MKQVIRRGLKEIIVDEVPDPVVTPHHVVVRPLASLISSGTETASIHTDSLVKEVADNPSHLAKIWNVLKAMGPAATFREVRAKFSEYAVLGYAGAGVIAAKHPTVTDLEIGDRVAYGGEGTGHGEAILTGRNLVARVPEQVPFDQAAFATLGAIAMNTVRIAEIGLGDQVAVIGLGLVGQLIAQLTRLQGGVVLAIDLKDDRIAMARRLGADVGLNGGAGLREAVLAATGGRGVDCAIIAAAAKSSAPCTQALEITRDRGRLVVVGAVEMAFPWHEMYLKEIRLSMARAYGPGSYDPEYEKRGVDYPLPYVRWTENRNMEEFLRLVGAGRVDIAPLITHRFPLERAAEAYQAILDPAAGSLAVVLEYPAAQAGGALPIKHTVAAAPPAAAKGSLTVALAGAGNLAKWAHLPILQKTPGVRLKAIHSSSGARGKSYALRFDAELCTSDYEALLRDPEIDLVILVTRNAEHARQAEAALRAGKHVLVEKPMALTVDECRALVRAVEESGKQLTVGFNRRFAPDYVALKRQLARRASPAVVQARVNSPGISGSYWMADPAIGGAILGEACHFVDLFAWLLETEFESVSAYSLPVGKGEPVGENNLAASFRFRDGSVANLTYCTVGSRTSGGERVEVFSQGLGAATEDFKSLTVAGGRRSASRRWFADKGYQEQMEAFLAAVREGRPAPVTVRDGARATLACLQMLASARRGGEPCAIELGVVGLD